MREIKFRAWCNKNKQWLSRSNLHLDLTGILFWNFGGSCRFEGNQKLADITLMQYTGLKDKWGVEIYEGDLVICERPKLYTRENPKEIKWSNLLSGFGITPDWAEKFEVIGNIYENGESNCSTRDCGEKRPCASVNGCISYTPPPPDE